MGDAYAHANASAKCKLNTRVLHLAPLELIHSDLCEMDSVCDKRWKEIFHDFN